MTSYRRLGSGCKTPDRLAILRKGLAMDSPLNALRVACVVFGLVALAQLARVLFGAEVAVNGHLVPLWASGVAFVIAGGLSAWMGRLSYRGMK
jgi:hypothetical protein